MNYQNLESERMQNDPDNYVLGLFYFNPKDKRVIVPKRNRMLGWTINFARPYSYMIIIGIIVLAVIMDKLVQ